MLGPRRVRPRHVDAREEQRDETQLDDDWGFDFNLDFDLVSGKKRGRDDERSEPETGMGFFF